MAGERFGAHALRRTCAKLCRKNGGNIEQIKFLLGHSSISTTQVYTRVDAARLRDTYAAAHPRA